MTKRSIILGLVVIFALSACQSGKTVGTPVCAKGQKSTAAKPCVKLGEQFKTPTPTPSTSSKPRSSTSTKPSPTEPPKPTCKTYKGKTYDIIIKDVYTKYQPENKRLYRGDYIRFINKDPVNKHSLTVEGTNFDTGILSSGQSKTLRVLLAPKLYKRWYDRQVSYVDGGPLDVLANPLCPL